MGSTAKRVLGIRRTTAILAQKMETVKDVQGILRHSRTETTTDVYMQEIPEGVPATVDSIHRELKSEGSPKLRNERKRGQSPGRGSKRNRVRKQRTWRKEFSRSATKCYQPNG